MSGMVIKSVTACVVSMAAAAGVTWFGTAPDANAGEHPHRMEDKAKVKADIDRKEKMDTQARNAKDRATSTVVVTSEAERSPTRSAPTGSTRGLDRGTTNSVITRMMQGDDDDAKPSMSRDKMEDDDKPHRATRRIVKRMSGDDEEVEIEVFVMDENSGDDMSEALLEKLEADRLKMREGRSSMPADMDSELERIMSEMSLVTKRLETDIEAVELPGALRSYRKAKPGELLETTKTIDDDDLRDQALYAVTTYALRFDDFGAAKTAVSKIESRDLRDTARSRMAIRHAELGDIEKALSVIEKLESEDLRDIIRVQMIETLTTPLEQRKALPGY